MFSRKDLKRAAKKSVKNHILIYMVSLLVAAVLGISYISALDIFTIREDIAMWRAYHNIEMQREPQELVDQISTTGGISLYSKLMNVWRELAQGKINETQDKTQQEIQQKIDEEKNQLKENAILGHSEGVFSSIVNSISSGQVLVSIVLVLRNITGSDDIAIMLFIIFSLIIILFIWVFFLNLFSVVYKRIFMEGRIYEDIPVQRFMFIFKSGRWCKVAMTMLLKAFYETLWWLTIAGGIIKKYSYFMVPYIIAENPDISPNAAITLSRRMMKGHKWECFLMTWSFILWDLLDILLYGIVGAVFLNSYKEATYAEYYVYIRALAKEKRLALSELLNDKYLFEIPDDETIQTVYKDAYELVNASIPVYIKKKGFIGFLTNTFGITLFYGKEDEIYQKYMAQTIAIKHVKSVVLGKTYPTKLQKVYSKSKINLIKKRIDDLEFMRHYSVPSLIAMFFVVSFIGWLWEVSIHLVTDGRFVNRGVLHGPWLPIYGAGSILILVLLFYFRKNPVLEFIAAIVLCGIVEYCTGWFLEITHDGKKWWDYSGYFLNLNGRICAEGLLIFGLGGITFVYLLAPLIDNFLRKISMTILVPLCVIFIIVFAFDTFYSFQHPNEGKGITDYAYKMEDILNVNKGDCYACNIISTNIYPVEFIFFDAFNNLAAQY